MTNLEKTHEYLKNKKKKASPTFSTNKEKENH
jgi:hypothetical protein